jgi:hypothetical protein
MAAASVDKPRWLASPGIHQFSSAWADIRGVEQVLASSPDPFGRVESR